jgi:transcriptional repressor NrdR
MVCTYCWSETHVINSRPQKRTNSVWRRRKCISCGRVFSTSEVVDYEKSWVVQYSSAKRPSGFVRDKLLMSVHASLGHRPTALPDALGLTKTIIGNLGKMVDHKGVLESVAIVSTTLDVLKRFDKVAATVYQAYHSDVI